MTRTFVIATPCSEWFCSRKKRTAKKNKFHCGADENVMSVAIMLCIEYRRSQHFITLFEYESSIFSHFACHFHRGAMIPKSRFYLVTMWVWSASSRAVVRITMSLVAQSLHESFFFVVLLCFLAGWDFILCGNLALLCLEGWNKELWSGCCGSA